MWVPHSSCCDTPLPWHPCALHVKSFLGPFAQRLKSPNLSKDRGQALFFCGPSTTAVFLLVVYTCDPKAR